jgi:hypothetical protein
MKDQRDWPVYHGAMYWTFSEFAWVGFFHPMPNGSQWIVRHELTFTRRVPELAAEDILALSRRHRFKLAPILAQPGIWPKPRDRGQFVPETFRRNGVTLRAGAGNTEASMGRLRSWLQPLRQVDGVIAPTLLIHRDCDYLIRTLPGIEENPANREDMLVTPDSYPAQAVGFFVMSRPMPKRDAPVTFPPGAVGHEVEELRRKAAQRV